MSRDADDEDARRLRAAFVRCFAGDDGGRVLRHLRRVTIERRTPPDAPEAVLRHLEGQRALVALIEAMAEPARIAPDTHDTYDGDIAP